MRLLTGLGIAAFWLGLAWWALRAVRRYDEHVSIPEMRKRWSRLKTHEREGHRQRFEGDRERHQLRRVQ